MNIYKKMYYKLFNEITEAINCETKEVSDKILRNAQMETEDMYINSDED